MPNLFAQVEFQYSSNIATDVAVNTWSFISATTVDDAQALDLIGQGLLAFYEAIDEYLSEGIIGEVTRLKVFDLADPTPRVPIGEGNLPIAGTGGNPMADEVACCLSFNAVQASGVSAGRRKGRVFLGPLSTLAGEEDGMGHLIPRTAFRSDLQLATAAMQVALTTDVLHAVYSRADDQLRPVFQYSMDNAFDTQKSRGKNPSSRVVWAA